MRENKPVREGWQRDSPCTITSVFRPGQLKGLLDMALLMLFLCTGFSNGNTFLSCLAAIPCLDFSLQTALYRLGRACSPSARCRAPGPHTGGGMGTCQPWDKASRGDGHPWLQQPSQNTCATKTYQQLGSLHPFSKQRESGKHSPFQPRQGSFLSD